MNEAAFAGFLAALGHRVQETASGYWYDASRVFLLATPSHLLRSPSDVECRSLLRWPALGVRFTSPIEGPGKRSYQIVCDDRQYALERLSANTRSKIRRGLKRCEIRRAEPAEVATAGQQAHADTIARQGRPGVLAGDRWERFWTAAATTSGMEVWAAWVEDKLAAFVVTMGFGDSVEFLLARSRSDCLPAYPNNALLYVLTEEMLVRRGVAQITFGIESLESVEALDEFKFAMGFRTEPLRQRVVFHPLLAAALRQQPVRAAFYRWAQAKRHGVFWRKAAGLVRFAEEAGS